MLNMTPADFRLKFPKGAGRSAGANVTPETFLSPYKYICDQREQKILRFSRRDQLLQLPVRQTKVYCAVSRNSIEAELYGANLR